MDLDFQDWNSVFTHKEALDFRKERKREEREAKKEVSEGEDSRQRYLNKQGLDFDYLVDTMLFWWDDSIIVLSCSLLYIRLGESPVSCWRSTDGSLSCCSSLESFFPLALLMLYSFSRKAVEMTSNWCPLECVLLKESRIGISGSISIHPMVTVFQFPSEEPLPPVEPMWFGWD